MKMGIGTKISCIVLAIVVPFDAYIYFRDSERKEEAEAAKAAEEKKVQQDRDADFERLKAAYAATNHQTRSEFDSILGVPLYSGVRLYRKLDHKQYGVVMDISGSKVQVALAEGLSVSGQRIEGNAIWLERSYITANLVMKK
jgi:hypothetical protein